MGRNKVHQAKADRLNTGVGCDVKGAVHGSRRFNQDVQRQICGTGADQRSLGAVDIGHRLDLGHHDVRQNPTGTACNDGHVGVKTGVINSMNAHSDAGIGCCSRRAQCQFGDQCCMFGFATDRRTVFAIQGDVKDASAELLGHFRLQLQAFAHPRFHSAVVVTHRQLNATGLRPQQNFARMGHSVSLLRIRSSEQRQLARRSTL